MTDESILQSLDNWYDELVEYSTFPNITDSYKVVLPTQTLLYIVEIRINPCKNRATTLCCQGLNAGACEDHPIIQAGPNLEIAWAFNNYIILCSNEFIEEPECGTFIEIHRPKESLMLSSLRITKDYSTGYSTEYLYTKNLCAGPYEVTVT